MARKGKPTVGQLEKKIKQLEGNWKRALADYLNLEKRVEKQRSIFATLAAARVLDKLLPVLDELEICQEHLRDDGLKLVIEKLEGFLKSEGAQKIVAQGKEFDPQTMDAVEIVSGPANKVIEVTNQGYSLNGKVLRPAKVKVGKGKEKQKIKNKE